jgi:tetratricopeptide (TPR) repeat protein
VTPARLAIQVETALAAAADDTADAAERAQMLMEIAMGLQQRPKTLDHLPAAVELYDKALAVCPSDRLLLRARIAARRGTALQAMPEPGVGSLQAARAAFEEALTVIAVSGEPAEIAEVEMNLGLVLQVLAGAGKARITDAIAAYQRALRVFDRRRYAVEFAILQSNLATSFLSIPASDEKAPLREALAVQAFEEGLRAINLIDHPAEYAMLQNNLGNALQYASTSHSIENNLRALQAYDEALKVRTPENAPSEYANTIANKANCLRNLPDDPTDAAAGNHANLVQAKVYYQVAGGIFDSEGDIAKAEIVADALAELEIELAAADEASGDRS